MPLIYKSEKPFLHGLKKKILEKQAAGAEARAKAMIARAEREEELAAVRQRPPAALALAGIKTGAHKAGSALSGFGASVKKWVDDAPKRETKQIESLKRRVSIEEQKSKLAKIKRQASPGWGMSGAGTHSAGGMGLGGSIFSDSSYGKPPASRTVRKKRRKSKTKKRRKK